MGTLLEDSKLIKKVDFACIHTCFSKDKNSIKPT